MRIIFEFAGGPLDGKAVVGRSGEQDEADRYFVLTHHGKIGQRFRIASDYAVETLAREQLKVQTPHHFQPHYYRVAGRIEEAGEVLVRAEYVETHVDDRVRTAASEGASGPKDQDATAERSRVAHLGEILLRSARSWKASYSHCWPVESSPENSLIQLLALHLGHALLSDRFAVFPQVRQAGYPNQAVELLGIAPSQDWFVACRMVRWSSDSWTSQVRRVWAQLAEFRLTGSLTIPACRDHVNRVARHSQRGWGLMAGLHWAPPSGATPVLLREWELAAQTGRLPSSLLPWENCPPGADSAVWMAPQLLGSFENLGACFLLAVCLPLLPAA